MTRKEINFKHDGKDGFLTACMNNKFNTNQTVVDKCLAASRDTEEFIDNYLCHKEEMETQFYGELIKRERRHLLWGAVRDCFGNKQFKTESDAGSVRIGNESFSVLIPNGWGDGVTRVAVFENNYEFKAGSLLSFFTTVSGDFGVYAYDCGGSEVVAELSGWYAAYYGEGFVALVRW